MRQPVLASKVPIRELPEQGRTEVLPLVKLLAQLTRTLVGFPSRLRRPTLRRTAKAEL
jgi:hypothetical protein